MHWCLPNAQVPAEWTNFSKVHMKQKYFGKTCTLCQCFQRIQGLPVAVHEAGIKPKSSLKMPRLELRGQHDSKSDADDVLSVQCFDNRKGSFVQV